MPQRNRTGGRLLYRHARGGAFKEQGRGDNWGQVRPKWVVSGRRTEQEKVLC